MQFDMDLFVKIVAIAIPFLLALLAGAWGLTKLVATQFSLRMDAKFEALSTEVKARDSRLEKTESELRTLDREFRDYKLEVRMNYMTQDDRTQLATDLKGRMDGLANKIQELLNVARH